MKQLFLLALFTCSLFGAFAQNGVIKGQLTDALTNEPIAFGDVLVLGTDKGASTDIDGN